VTQSCCPFYPTEAKDCPSKNWNLIWKSSSHETMNSFMKTAAKMIPSKWEEAWVISARNCILYWILLRKRCELHNFMHCGPCLSQSYEIRRCLTARYACYLRTNGIVMQTICNIQSGSILERGIQVPREKESKVMGSMQHRYEVKGWALRSRHTNIWYGGMQGKDIDRK